MPVEHVNALPKGTQLNQYELVSVLGAGGFGITYMARDTSLDTLVAIKEYLPGDLAARRDDSTVTAKSTTSKGDFDWGLDRFLSEARTLAKFRHPNIVRVNQIFQANNTAYLVMEYAKGQSLEDALHAGPLTEEQTKQMLAPILDGLQRVHEQGFLHRDIKPANIILRDDGGSLLIDFGAARQAMESRSRALTSIVTEGYAPLEQYHGTGHQGPWTDIYALGAVAYRCLTGSKPPSAAARVRNDPLVPIAVAAKNQVSSHFAAVIAAALNLDERLRPQSIAEFRAMMDGKMSAQLVPGAGEDATRMFRDESATHVRWPAATASESAASRDNGVLAERPGMSARAGSVRPASAEVRAPASRGNMPVYLGVAAAFLIAVGAAWYVQTDTPPGAIATKPATPQTLIVTQQAAPLPALPPSTDSAPPPPPRSETASTATTPPAVATGPAAPPLSKAPAPPPPETRTETPSTAAAPPAVMTGPPPSSKAAAPPPVTIRTSFNCRTPKNSAERIVCSDRQLAALDVEAAELYQLGLRSVTDPNAFRGEQQAWLAQRDECNNKACLVESYGQRIRELERWVGP
jgi:serine/threonine protein kinase/uncharacterized protein YecT (DUF1311 family)